MRKLSKTQQTVLDHMLKGNAVYVCWWDCIHYMMVENERITIKETTFDKVKMWLKENDYTVLYMDRAQSDKKYIIDFGEKEEETAAPKSSEQKINTIFKDFEGNKLKVVKAEIESYIDENGDARIKNNCEKCFYFRPGKNIYGQDSLVCHNRFFVCDESERDDETEIYYVEVK